MRKRLLSISVSLMVVIFVATAVPAKTYVWRMGTTWTPSIALIDADRHFTKLVNDLSGGQLKIRLYSAGELVPAFELFDAVARGTLQAGGDWPNYWAGKNTAFDLLGSYPMGLTPIDYAVWIYQGGGLTLYNKVYGKYGMVYFPHAVTPMESGVRGHKPIRTLADFKGLKIRMSGRTQGKILRDLGAAQVMLAGSEIYQALEKGTIDAAEFCSPSIDWGMGFAEVTEYWVTPGWHQPASVLGVMINKKAWNQLPDNLKEVVKTAAMANFLWSFTHFEYGNIDAVKKFLAKGTKITRLDDKALNRIQELANKYMVDEAKNNPLFAEIAYSQVKFLKDIAQWRAISTPFTYGRNPKVLPDLNQLRVKTKK